MIRIVTDSSCDLPDDLVELHRITIVPLTIRFGDDDFVDRTELSGDEFWRRLTTENTLPETAAPSVGRFLEAYRSLEAEGADGILVIAISSKISATHQSATLAAEQFASGIPVRVVDSGLVSMALGLVVIEAAEGADAGLSLDAITAASVERAASSNLFAALDTLEFLRRGGRIGSAAAFFGTLLNVKPIISFEDGAVAAAGRVRTRKRAVAAVGDHMADLGDRVARFAVIHSEPDDLEAFVEALADERGSPPLVARLGPVVGTHAGPGVLGVVYRLA